MMSKVRKETALRQNWEDLSVDTYGDVWLPPKIIRCDGTHVPLVTVELKYNQQPGKVATSTPG